MKEKPKKRYTIINKHPEYSSEEERQAAYKRVAREIAISTMYLEQRGSNEKS